MTEESASHSNRSMLVLSGRPPVREFLRTVKSRAIGGASLDDVELWEEWSRACKIVHELEAKETDAADIAELEHLPETIAETAAAALLDPQLQRAFRPLKYSWAWVELDRLIAWQQYVDLTYARKLSDSLPRAPTSLDLLNFALGKTLEETPIHVTMRNGNKYSFSSPSSDLRVLNTVALGPGNIVGYDTHGQVVSAIAVLVGYSVNAMVAARMGSRLLLLNGTHRAYTLRARGLIHAPCIVRHISNKEELELLGTGQGGRHFEGSFSARRPSMLRDFFDERLTKSFSTVASTHVLDLALQIEHSIVQHEDQ